MECFGRAQRAQVWIAVQQHRHLSYEILQGGRFMKRFENIDVHWHAKYRSTILRWKCLPHDRIWPGMRRSWSRVAFKGDHHMVMHRRISVWWLWIISPVDQLGG